MVMILMHQGNLDTNYQHFSGRENTIQYENVSSFLHENKGPKILGIDIRYAWIAKNLITSEGQCPCPIKNAKIKLNANRQNLLLWG